MDMAAADGIHAMVERDRMIEPARMLRDVYAITPGQRLIRREFGFYSLEAWEKQGMPTDVPRHELFDYDPGGGFSLGGLGWCEAAFCPAFEDLFFDVLEKAILADGRIQASEQFYLLKLLYSDREIRDREKDFLLKLKREARQTTPEFDALCDEALQAHPTAWSVGGR